MKVYKQSLISIFIERNIKLFHTKKLKVHEGEKIYWRLLLLRKVVGGVSEMWKMIRECGDENKAAVLCKGQRQLLNRPHISLFCTR